MKQASRGLKQRGKACGVWQAGKKIGRLRRWNLSNEITELIAAALYGLDRGRRLVKLTTGCVPTAMMLLRLVLPDVDIE